MKTFLEYVAEDIIRKYGTDLSHITVVFPNKRASLFLNGYLAQLSDKPIWSPVYMTISELFRQHSTLTVADPIKLVCELHKSFVSMTGIDESLDHFYGWGQVLLADFDDLDKNMADADKVFANVRDIHELDDVSYLSPEQREAIKQFFSTFSDDHNTLLRQRFLQLWSKMADIYHDFNQRLAAQGLAYEGALYRLRVESLGLRDNSLSTAKLKPLNPQPSTYLFVGFNLLQRVEQQLFLALKREGIAHFYWDFDQAYMNGDEAGHFIGKYLEYFPNELDIHNPDIYGQWSQPKDIRIISATTENAQARYISQWLRQDKRIEAGRSTAIVLCNEGLLPMVIHCLPDEVEKVNITTGYPLSQSPVASLINMLVNMRVMGGKRKYVEAVMRHPYMAMLPHDEARTMITADEALLPWIASILKRIVEELRVKSLELSDVRPSDARQKSLNPQPSTLNPQPSPLNPLLQESLFRAYTLINRLKELSVESLELSDVRPSDARQKSLNPQPSTLNLLQRLIGQLIQSTTVPFHGEPAEGLQVMGVLETRNLDFDHVILLSCNEGNMPRGVNDSSFIPYGIRKAYGLTTIDHKVAIYSYYFHRLLQRAKDITILYNNSTNNGQTGEMSRFMLQMMVENRHHNLTFHTLEVPASINHSEPPVINKPSTLRSAQRDAFLRKNPQPSLLSPTAINTYLRCQLRYYYKYECDLKEPLEDSDDVIDNRIFGNIFHEASQIIYQKLIQKSRQIMPGDIDALLKARVDIERAVDEAMQKELRVKSLELRDVSSSVAKLKSLNSQPLTLNPQPLNGLQLINREVLIHYLRQLLTIDRRLAPFGIIDLECDVYGTIETPHIKTRIGGRIDRLDRIVKDNQEYIRVIDYKTSSKNIKSLPDVDAIFKQESLANHSDYYLQAFLYASLVKQQYPHTPVSPALLFIQHAGADNYDPTLCLGKEPVTDIKESSARFRTLLEEVVDQMFDPDLPYQPTDDRSRCNACPYRLLCGI